MPVERPAGVCPGGQEDLVRPDPAPGGLDLVPGAGPGQPLHRGLLVDRHAGALGCLAEPADVLAHMETSALRLDHSAVEHLAPDLATQVHLRDQLRVTSQATVQQLRGLRESLVVRGLGREVELAGACEVAVDPLLGHQLLHEVDRFGVGAVEPCRGLEAQLVHCLPDADRHASGGHAPVATRSAEPHGVLLEQVHLRSAPSQVQSRHDAGQATADDGHVGASTHGGLRPLQGTLGRGVEPVGRELHTYSSHGAQEAGHGHGGTGQTAPSVRRRNDHQLLTVDHDTRMVDNRPERMGR